MTAQIDSIRITGLHGTSQCIDARLKDNTLIIVGENGSGKTTFLRMVFNLLAGKWRSLGLVRFDSIVLVLDKHEYVVHFADIRKAMEKIDERVMLGLPSGARQAVIEALEFADVRHDPQVFANLEQRYGIPVRHLLRQTEFLEESESHLSRPLRSAFREISKQLDSQILYLPTYRRIEEELASIVDWLDVDELRRKKPRHMLPARDRAFIELVEFGMQDVERSIGTTLDNLRAFQSETLRVLTLKHFGDIVSKTYTTEDIERLSSLPDSTIQTVLERVEEPIVDAPQREGWLRAIHQARSKKSPDEHDKIICHYFLKLLDFQESLRVREQPIAKFCEVCSRYIQDKAFEYDSSTFAFRIRPHFKTTGEELIKLSELSSGEKQVVSLFSHLYLSGQSSYIVLIDEPELSLSVPWQRRFLVDIRNSNFCRGLVAATHSPFIYDNDLKKYAHSLGEYVDRT